MLFEKVCDSSHTFYGIYEIFLLPALLLHKPQVLGQLRANHSLNAGK